MSSWFFNDEAELQSLIYIIIMNINLIWTGFIILISVLEELDKRHFVLFGGSMFYFVYLYNQVKPTNISSKSILLLFNIPTLIFWYIGFVYNDFLSKDSESLC